MVAINGCWGCGRTACTCEADATITGTYGGWHKQVVEIGATPAGVITLSDGEQWHRTTEGTLKRSGYIKKVAAELVAEFRTRVYSVDTCSSDPVFHMIAVSLRDRTYFITYPSYLEAIRSIIRMQPYF